MALEVVHTQYRNFQGRRQRTGNAGTHQQGPGQTWTLGESNDIHLTQTAPTLRKHLLCER